MQKSNLAESSCIFECLLMQNTSNQSAQLSHDSSKLNEWLSQNKKNGDFRELFLPKSDFKTMQ